MFLFSSISGFQKKTIILRFVWQNHQILIISYSYSILQGYCMPQKMWKLSSHKRKKSGKTKTVRFLVKDEWFTKTLILIRFILFCFYKFSLKNNQIFIKTNSSVQTNFHPTLNSPHMIIYLFCVCLWWPDLPDKHIHK